MSRMVQVKMLDVDDTGIYRALRLEGLKREPYAFSESYEDEVLRGATDFENDVRPVGDPARKFVLGAFANGALIGFVTFRRDQRAKARHKAMLHGMYVHHEHRNSGVGRALLERIIELSRAMNGLEQIHLWVLHAYESVAGFYLKQGFISQGTIVQKDLKVGDVYVNAEYMVRYL